MEQIGSMQILDSISHENCYVAIKVADKYIGITISQENNGDAEVFFATEHCQALINWLEKAKMIADSQEGQLPR